MVNTVAVPMWVMPTLMILTLGATGMYIKTVAADEAKEMLQAYTKTARARLDTLETMAQKHETRIQLTAQDLAAIRAVAEQAQKDADRNNRILIGIAAKLNVPTEDSR